MGPKVFLNFWSICLVAAAILPRPCTADSQQPKAVFVHMTMDFSKPDTSEQWRGWNHSNAKVEHSPDTIKKDGKRDIASIYYPLIGPYDTTDPFVVEYHTQLMKMAGIDGAVINVSFFYEPNDPQKQKATFACRAAQLYLQSFKLYHLKAIPLFEDKAQWIWYGGFTNREDTVAATLDHLGRWQDLFQGVQYYLDGHPVILIFSYNQQVPGRGISRLTADELYSWKRHFHKLERPVVFTNQYYQEFSGIHDGVFQWPEVTGKAPAKTGYTFYNDFKTEKELWQQKDKQDLDLLEQEKVQWVCGTVWPGFDDAGCMSWGEGHKVIPRFSGDLYRYHWQRITQAKYPLVMIATWNDWCEGLNIEPDVESGYQYLEITRQQIGQWKGQAVPTGNFRVAEWIYEIRKNARRSEKAMSAAEQASEAIQTGDYQKAENIIMPFVKVLDLE